MADVSHTRTTPQEEAEPPVVLGGPAPGGLVGRAHELALLRDRIDAAAAGSPSLTLVVGDGGIGKTRLVAELQTAAAAAGMIALRGDCLELSVGELPYAPLAGALRDAEPAVIAAALAQLSPDGRRELARIVPDLVDEAPAPPAPDDRFGQSRLFGWLLALLRQLSRSAPVLLRIEDLHSADPSSRDFLRFLLQSVRGERLVVVATVRLDDLGRDHPVRGLLAELGRSPLVTTLGLDRLSRDEVGQLVAQLATGMAPRLVDSLFERSEGNPFYCEELLAAADSDPDGLPDSLRDVLLLRVAGLGDGPRHVLSLVATAARPVDDATIAGAAGLAGDECELALRTCIDRGLLVFDRRAGAYSVRHALLREALGEDMLPAELTACHRALARSLEQHATAENAADRARHWAAAGEPGPALTAAIAAADAAEAVSGYGEALSHCRHALALWTAGSPPVPLPFDRISLLARAAQAARFTGRSDLARELCEQALAAIDPIADPLRTSRLHERLGRYQPWDVEGSLAHYATALALLGPDATADRMRLLADEALYQLSYGPRRAAHKGWGRGVSSEARLRPRFNAG